MPSGFFFISLSSKGQAVYLLNMTCPNCWLSHSADNSLPVSMEIFHWSDCLDARWHLTRGARGSRLAVRVKNRRLSCPLHLLWVHRDISKYIAKYRGLFKSRHLLIMWGHLSSFYWMACRVGHCLNFINSNSDSAYQFRFCLSIPILIDAV